MATHGENGPRMFSRFTRPDHCMFQSQIINALDEHRTLLTEETRMPAGPVEKVLARIYHP